MRGVDLPSHESSCPFAPANHNNLASKDIVGFINPFPADEQPTTWESGIVDAAATEKLRTR